jgi:hypothetical protein
MGDGASGALPAGKQLNVMGNIVTKDIIAVALSLALFAGAAWDRWSVLPTQDPAPFHAHLRAVAASLPDRFGPWTSSDHKSESTEAYLHANIMIDREFVNGQTGEHASFLFIQCPDIRDLVPHFPAVCYPGQGKAQVEDPKTRTWNVGGLSITGTEYSFESETFKEADGVIVDNFMLLPGNQISKDMKEVRAHVPLRNRFYGVGQIQVVFPIGMPAARRDAVFVELVAAYKPLIDAILAGKVE